MKAGLGTLKSAGFKITHQRRAVLEAIRDSGKHMSAEEIHEKVKQKCPHAGLATTYRTLELLKELSLISDIALGEDHNHYEWKKEHHYHLVCLACGDIIEFSSNFVAVIEKNVQKDYGFEITGEHVEFSGYCSKCVKRRNRR